MKPTRKQMKALFSGEIVNIEAPARFVSYTSPETGSDIREKITELITHHPSVMSEDYNLNIELAISVLSLVREAVSAVKPKERITPHEERFDDEIRCGNVGYNQGVSDYHDALIKTFT